ncbi:MAG: hypothetical protein ABIH84_02510, partial [bacterium]
GPQGAFWQFTNVGKVDFTTQISQFVTTLAEKLPVNLGYGAALIFAVGLGLLIYQLIKKRPTNHVVSLAALTFLGLAFYVSGLEKNRSHYYMISYPYFLLVAGWVLSRIISRLNKIAFKALLVAAIFLPSIVLSIQNIVDLQTKTSSSVYGGDVEESVKIKM